MSTSKLDKILNKLADDQFYSGMDVGDEPYASDGYEANTGEAITQVKALFKEIVNSTSIPMNGGDINICPTKVLLEKIGEL